MNIFLVLAYLFFIGSLFGWILELLFRNIVHKSEKWINPGFCTGPYVPLYGFGLCVLFLLASLENFRFIKSSFWNKTLLFVVMAICMTLIEYVAGIFCLKCLKVRLWDYSNQWGNIQGIICPSFSLVWAVLGAVYYFLIHQHILNMLRWLSNNLAFSFFIGVFFGIFIIDVIHSANLVTKLKKFAEENKLVIKYEEIKAHIKERQKSEHKKVPFFLPFKSDHSLTEHLKEFYGSKYIAKHSFKDRRKNQQ